MDAQFPREQSSSGEFARQEDVFRLWISKNGSTPYPAIANRYHLYVSLACPWASRALFGARTVEADWRLFCTLVRFDAAYHGHFKCNLRRITDYPNLQGYLMGLYQRPRIAETVNFDHIKRHYYITHDQINPTRIVPIGPELDLNQPHGRDRF